MEHFDMAGMSTAKAMVAGAAAGVAEHLVMFPIDTIKTRMQQMHTAENAQTYASVKRSLKTILREEGVRRLYRGLPAATLGAIPAHALHFSSYEALKDVLGARRDVHTPVANMMAGFGATMVHDAVSTPVDVVKQRLQVAGSRFTTVRAAVRGIWAAEGLAAFYASYPTTVLMNVPYMITHFTVYEAVQTSAAQVLGREHTPMRDIFAGACAGALGGLISNPLDVLRTRIQTQEMVPGAARVGAREMARRIFAEEGLAGFARGARARVLLFTPSAAICWGVYETLKRLFDRHNRYHEEHDHHHHNGHGHGHGHGHGQGHGRGHGHGHGDANNEHD
jgi:solute carrier family 25 iron transporter 28/37